MKPKRFLRTSKGIIFFVIQISCDVLYHLFFILTWCDVIKNTKDGQYIGSYPPYILLWILFLFLALVSAALLIGFGVKHVRKVTFAEKNEIKVSLNDELLREIPKEAMNSAAHEKAKEEPLFTLVLKDRKLDYRFCLYLSFRVFYGLYLLMIFCGVVFFVLFLSLLGNESLLARMLFYFLLPVSISFCFLWPFFLALLLKSKVEIFADMPEANFYADRFEFASPAVGEDGKSYGDVAMAFPYEGRKIIKSKRYLILFYKVGRKSNFIPLWRNEIPALLDEKILGNSCKKRTSN